jgi:CHAT domain-containing protein/uncharacterized protein HemY
MKFLQLSSIAFVSFFLTFFNDIQALFSLNSLSENPKSLIHLSPVLAQTSTDKKAEADRLLDQGIQQAKTSQFRAAIQSWEQSLKLYQEIGDRKGEANSLNNLGNAYGSLGQYQKAIKFYQQSLSVQQQIGDRNRVAKSLMNLGNAYLRLGEYQKAIDFYQQSLSIQQQIGDRNGVANSLNNLGSAYDSLGEYQKALKFYQQSLSIRQQISDRNGVAVSLNNLGNAYLRLGEYQKAIDFYQQSLPIFQEISDRNGVASSLMNLGNAYLRLREYQKAIEFYQQSLSIRQEIGDHNGVASSLGSLGNAYSSLGEYQKAIKFYQQSLSIFQEIGYRNGVAIFLDNIGNAYRHMGQLGESEQWLKEAIKSYEVLRLGLKDLDKISIFDTQINSYIFLQDVLIKQNKIEEGLEIADRARARALIDELAKRHLDLSKEAIEFPPLSIEQIKQTAKNKKANLVIYSIILDRFKTPNNLIETKESELYIWVVKPTGEVHFRQVDLKPLWQQQQTTLEEIVSKTTVSLATGGIYRSDGPRFPQIGDLVRLKGEDDPEIYPSRIIAINQQTQTVTVTNPSFDQESEEKPISDIISYETSPVAHHQGSQQLHQLLIEPIADLLPKDENERIIFIPQGALLYVPFAALQDQQGNVLIQKHTILTAPAIQVLAIAPDHQSTGKNALVVGNPIMPKISNQVGETPQPLSPLPGSEQEAKAIAQLLQTQAILGENATETAIIEKMPQADIIHFATHGLIGDFTGGGVPGAIALTPNPSASSPDIWGLDGGDGLLMAEEILKLKLKANLVVLSACSTGQGRLTGDGIIGLSRSLMTAGVPSVLVTLWKVDDDKTVTLMTEFYRQLQQNPDKAKALRTAMLKLLQTDPKPQYWAAFTLIGAPE